MPGARANGCPVANDAPQDMISAPLEDRQFRMGTQLSQTVYSNVTGVAKRLTGLAVGSASLEADEQGKLAAGFMPELAQYAAASSDDAQENLRKFVFSSAWPDRGRQSA